MAAVGGPERIALDTTGQAMTHEQWAAYARAKSASLPKGGGASTGMRPEHSAMLNAALGRTHELLAGLAGIHDHAVTACGDFGTTEDVNEQAVIGLNADVPKLA